MAEQKPRTIVGVIGSPSAGRGAPGGAWTLVLFLQPFRLDGEIITDKEMRVEAGPISREALSSWMSQLHVGKLITFQSTAVRDRPGWLASLFSSTREIFARAPLPIEPAPPDLELIAIRDRLAQPVVLTHPTFGEMTLLRELNSFEARREYNGGNYAVLIHRSHRGDDRAIDEADIERASSVALDIEQRMPAILGAIVKQMLPLYNQEWRGEAPPLDADTFRSRMVISEISIHADKGDGELIFGAGGLFTEHAIEVRFNNAGKVEINLA